MSKFRMIGQLNRFSKEAQVGEKKKKKKAPKTPFQKQEDKTEKAWKEACKRRDGFRCQKPLNLSEQEIECSGFLQVHHCVNSRGHNKTKYMLDNGITLCSKHHYFGAHSDKPEISRNYERHVKRRIGVKQFVNIETMKGVHKYSLSDLIEIENKLNSLYVM